MAVFMAMHERIGTFSYDPERSTTIVAGGKTVESLTRRILLKFYPAWTSNDPADVGPDVLDTDTLPFQTRKNLADLHGEGWKKILEDALGGEMGERWGIVKGDPRPLRPVKVTMTAKEFEEYKKANPNVAGKNSSPAVQSVVTGTRGTQDTRR